MNRRNPVVAGALIIGLAGTLPVEARQAATPVSVGSSGVAPLRLVTHVPPVYPTVALSAWVSGEVVLEATIGTDGRLGDLRVLRSIPLLDQAAIDAVRQWRFVPPMVSGSSAPVRVPISVSFLLHGGSLPLPPASVQSPSLPRDFAIDFGATCEDGSSVDFNTVTSMFERSWGPVSVRAHTFTNVGLLESIHRLIDKGGLMVDRTRLAQWPEVEPPFEISDSGVRVVLRAGRPGMIYLSPRQTRRYFLDVRMNGNWTRLFPPANWRNLNPPNDADERDRERGQKTYDIVQLLEKHFQSLDMFRRLTRNQQWCRWPD